MWNHLKGGDAIIAEAMYLLLIVLGKTHNKSLGERISDMKTKWQRFFSLRIFFVFTLVLIAGTGYTQTLEVITVPCVPGNPGIPHDTYNGVHTNLLAIARGGNGTYAYEWDFNGDGVYDFSSSTTNPYDLSTTHTYPDQVSNRLFIARIRVTSGVDTVTAEYRVMIHEPATQDVKVNRTIDNALWYLHTTMNRYTSGGVDYGNYPSQTLGATGMAAQAWAIQGHKVNGDYATNPYVEDIQKALNYCLSQTYTLPIAPELAGNPDSNGNGFGLYSSLESQLYETGIVLMALANSGDPTYPADAGLPLGVAGRSYQDIVQDMVDFLAFAQNENGDGRGGWRYAPNFSDSDMSVSQWPVIGLEAAEANPDFSGLITVPVWVKTELKDYFLTNDQFISPSDPPDTDGGFGYARKDWPNFPRTGAGLACQAWVGLTVGEDRVQRAINYLDREWLSGENFGSFYAMYAVNKGMRSFDPDITIIGTRDWYVEYANWLIANQASDGGWTDGAWFWSRDLTTAAGVLILVKEVIQPPPVAVADAQPKEAPPGAVITFDHSGSFHLDPGGVLVAFRWDFDEDGVWDFETVDINAKPNWIYNDDIGCGEEAVHPIILEVEDGEGLTDQDTESVTIKINLDNHPPVAIGDSTPSDPNYEVSQGGTVLLDASDSYDPDTGAPLKCDPDAPDDHIVKWEWDLDNDGIFDVEGETYPFDTPDDWEIDSTHTVQLRVTDDGSWAGPDGGGSKSGETTVTILVIPNIPPDCSGVAPSSAQIWPPNHKMVDIEVLGVTDPDGDPITIVITGITQDEVVNDGGDGDTSPDGAGIGSNIAQVRAERSGHGNGRVYGISFLAEDGQGGACTDSVQVCVPHDKKDSCIDNGQNYDSTQP